MVSKVLVAARSFAASPEAKAVLAAQGYELVLNPYDRPLTEAELLPLVRGVDALITGNDAVTAAVIAAGLPTLKIIAKHGVGYNTIDIAAAKRCGVPVTVTPGANSKSVADLALALMLTLARHVLRLDRAVRAGSWGRLGGSELSGKTLGIIGTGSIGGEVAKRAHGFDMAIIAYDVCPRPDLVELYGVKYLPQAAVLAQADFVSLHAPALPETRGMINLASLRTMKPTAYLINTARGDLIVEDDLYIALTEGIIAGAGLDTFVHEPLRDSRLFGLDNVVLTPHAGANTREAVIRTGVMAAEEVVRVLSGQPPLYPVEQKGGLA
jgi:D-3-phosphoglycerate dehydrogenase